MHPDQALRCLLINPEFLGFTFWNDKESCKLVRAKAPTPPLGLLTVAAILPRHWEFKLLDLYARAFSEAEWQWADVICVGGMFPQRSGILQVVDRARREGKLVAVGGPDPTALPEIYKTADALVLGEGETSIPLWLESWRKGAPTGIFRSDLRPDVTKSPIPKYELIKPQDYTQVALQYSRGCPFICEFCDAIELDGRVPRTKTPDQVLAELEHLYNLGFRGSVNMVDDNFIGNKRNVKQLLPRLIRWSKDKKYPFFFMTDASLNLADDKELLIMMEEAPFIHVFTGIENPDPELLRRAQKGQNTLRPIVERINILYQHGLSVSAGFIIGFDNEQPGTHKAIIDCIEATGVCKVDMNLLGALPNTQLTRRLLREGRLLSLKGTLVRSQEEAFQVEIGEKRAAGYFDGALNFVTTRSKAAILREYVEIIRTIYEPRRYMDRVLRTAKKLSIKSTHPLSWKEWIAAFRAGIITSVKLTRNPTTRYLFWRNVFCCLPLGLWRLQYAMMYMAQYPHFQKVTEARIRDLMHNWAETLKDQEKGELAERAEDIWQRWPGTIKTSLF
jgi:radical SAM superfamily enzyme YgiQ (UPF0313 family)